MKWIGWMMIVLGALCYVTSNAVEKKLQADSTLIQLVRNDQVVSEPFQAIVPIEVCFVKGSGKQGSKFVKVGEEIVATKGLLQTVALARLGSMFAILLGSIGVVFERWRTKTGAILKGEID